MASQAFPARVTLVLGIQGGCTPDTQPQNPYIVGNQRYRVGFQYNSNSVGLVTPFGMQGALAETIFGLWGDQFPARELVLEANDTIAQTVQNVSDTAITGTISYHCLIWKFAQ
ncbi:MAG: hypothetical protein JO086_15220 [Acidimicrobiia bacterium]|nr:hypothetical protein [Acidimicrobiia bacterium]